MTETLQLSSEFESRRAAAARDVSARKPREQVLEDMSFLDYRLAEVRMSPAVTLAEPDIVSARTREGDRLDGRR